MTDIYDIKGNLALSQINVVNSVIFFVVVLVVLGVIYFLKNKENK